MLCEKNKERTTEYELTIQEGLKVLGKKNLALILHGVSFPSITGEDTGFGTYNGESGRKLIDFASGIFSAIQLGPNGKTKASDSSPYTGTIFSQNPLFIDLKELTTKKWGNLLSDETYRKIIDNNPEKDPMRAAYAYACDAYELALTEVYENFKKNASWFLKHKFSNFKKENSFWLNNDALYEAFIIENKSDYWPQWENELDRNLFKSEDKKAVDKRIKEISKKYENVIEKYKLTQFIASTQADETRAYAKEKNIKMIADRQVAFSDRDCWAYQSLFLEGWALGCPPDYFSKDGQAWGFPVIDPEKLFNKDGSLGPAGVILKKLYVKMFKENPGGVRIDHTVGLIDPWVYKVGSLPKVEEGAGRLYSSPNHIFLNKFSIATMDDVNLEVEPDKEKWVKKLTDEQIKKYGLTIEKIVIAAANEVGLDKNAIVAEDLGTLTYPVEKVMEKYELQGMKLVQFVVAEEEDHPYRCKNITPHSWAMVGTHDNEPIKRWADSVVNTAEVDPHVDNLMEDMFNNFENKDEIKHKLYTDGDALAFAKLVEIFASAAENIQIFFTDFFGINEVYNKPGTSGDPNWTLRLSSNFEELYAENLSKGHALNLPKAIICAIKARGAEFASQNQEIIEKLNKLV
ncbi:MAG: 4-alpha-glucanotransferase [Cyanobacteria bacterium SIG30]|nr:4-alpha-glucanotransferase [Cyanobacteria bacterium SIG30]